MKICRVQEPVVSTIKHRSYEGQTLYCVVELDGDLNETGKELVVVDRRLYAGWKEVLHKVFGKHRFKIVEISPIPDFFVSS